MKLVQEKQRQKIEQFVERMPALSPTVGKIMEVCSRTDVSPNELHKVISLDPVLVGHVLKLVNSAYYSLISKVSSLGRAITMLGMNTVKNIALSAAIIGTVNAAKNKVLSETGFWKHSIATGVSAKLLGKQVGSFDGVRLEELFLAGLIHDLGKVPFSEEYIAVLQMAEREQVPLITVERELWGMDHQQVGALIAEKWQLNPSLYNCIANHHNTNELAKMEGGKTVALVAMGNAYANIHDMGFAGDLFPAEEDIIQLFEITGCPRNIFASIGKRIAEEVRVAEVFLQGGER